MASPTDAVDPLAPLVEAFAERVAEHVIARIASVYEIANAEPAWLDVKAAATYLCTTEDAVRSAVRRHQLPGKRGHGRVLFTTDELDRYVREGRA